MSHHRACTAARAQASAGMARLARGAGVRRDQHLTVTVLSLTSTTQWQVIRTSLVEEASKPAVSELPREYQVRFPFSETQSCHLNQGQRLSGSLYLHALVRLWLHRRSAACSSCKPDPGTVQSFITSLKGFQAHSLATLGNVLLDGSQHSSVERAAEGHDRQAGLMDEGVG